MCHFQPRAWPYSFPPDTEEAAGLAAAPTPAPLAIPRSHRPSSPSHLHPPWSLVPVTVRCSPLPRAGEGGAGGLGLPLSCSAEGPGGASCPRAPLVVAQWRPRSVHGSPAGGPGPWAHCHSGYTQPGAGFLVPRPLQRGSRGKSFRKVPPAWASHMAYLRVHTCSGAEARLSVGRSCPLSPLRAVARMVYRLPGSRALRERGGWSWGPLCPSAAGPGLLLSSVTGVWAVLLHEARAVV